MTTCCFDMNLSYLTIIPLTPSPSNARRSNMFDKMSKRECTRMKLPFIIVRIFYESRLISSIFYVSIRWSYTISFTFKMKDVIRNRDRRRNPRQ